MKSPLLLLVALAVLITPTNLMAQKTLENSLLWRISGKELSAPSYLFGTIHLLCQQDFVLRGQIIKAMNACKRIAFEVDFFSKTDMAKGAQLSMNPEGANAYKRWLGEAGYKQLCKILSKEFGIPDTITTMLRPMPLSLAVVRKSLKCSVTGAEGVVHLVSKRDDDTRGYKHEFTGLETSEDRANLGLFSQQSDSLMARDLLSGLMSNKSNFHQALTKMVQLYKTENIAALQTYITKADTQTMLGLRMTSVIVDKRNQLWLPRMEQMMREKTTFFAVGAGHLAGKPNGLIELLRKQGYTLEAITKREQIVGK
jgi:uncharacterized protein YbaP (TraB family)